VPRFSRHLDQGPHGHQGLITLELRNKLWKCTESYKGTKPDDKALKDGTASKATCTKL
jgi:hypothetical protein